MTLYFYMTLVVYRHFGLEAFLTWKLIYRKGIVEANATDHSFLLCLAIIYMFCVLCPKIKRMRKKGVMIVWIEIYSRIDLDGASELAHDFMFHSLIPSSFFIPTFPFVHKRERGKNEGDRAWSSSSEKMVVSCKRKWKQSDGFCFWPGVNGWQ